ILSEISQKEEAVNGITKTVFQKYLFPHYPELANRLFAHLHASSKATTAHLGQSAFKQQAEKFLAIMNDQTVLENYVKMFSDNNENEVTPNGLRELLMLSYRLAMAGKGGCYCAQLLNTISAVVTACFHGKDTLSVSFISNWLSVNCPRIVHGMHRYAIHVLTTAYRSGKVLMSNEQSGLHMVPSTPILDQPNHGDLSEALLPISHVWLLSSTLPNCYIKTEEENTKNQDGMHALITKMSGTVCPRHWTLLYNSNQHGAGFNRFLHHVLGYKGPTVLFIRGFSDSDERSTYPTYCICSAVEWRESHLYWGNEDSMVIEMLPNYRIIQKGSKLLYLNTSIRGYPQGLRAGTDPRNPCIIIDQAFNEVTFAGVPYRISSIEVWGCGDTKSREKQLEIKKWQVKEAEKQRVVKLSTSEWLDHPDRYLLELAGRPSYNNSSS
ncbi:uncharacterized protein LOC106646292, partial [Copidosoma floridanum]|uniref:uncharacterized protein LOC106646292 n=1 Tax=Copidosoma floridanum TaxID=29053 RepID=UPI0006C952A5